MAARREAIEKARAEERHWKLTQQARGCKACCVPRFSSETNLIAALLLLQGKTTEAQADLARLSLIKAQREEAAKKRAEDAAAALAKKATIGGAAKK